MNAYTYDAGGFRQVFESRFTWLNGFLRNVRRFGNKAALFDPLSGRGWTYETLNAEANRLAHALKESGVQKNDVIMFALLNSPEFVFCYLAAHKTGAIACPVNYRQGAGEMALVIDDSRPKVFIYHDRFKKLAEDALSLCKNPPGTALIAGPSGKGSYESYVSGKPETDPPFDLPPNIYDETLRLYTSGTTSSPKGVPVNNINEVLSAHDVMIHFPLGPSDRTMNLTPWFHRGGIHSGGPCPTLYAGGEVIVLQDFAPKRCLEYAEKYQISFLIGVPAVISMLARAQEHFRFDLSALNGLVAMGSPLDKAACERYTRVLTPKIFNGYGTTETFWNTFLRPSDLPGMAGSAGLSCTDDEVRVVALHADGTRAEPDETVPKDSRTLGEVIISSPAKSTFSYFNDAEMTGRKFYKGFLYTGDVGTWDQRSYITVEGRRDDMIVSAGENINPSQIEGILNSHPKVEESAVIGIPDRLRGEAVKAFIVASDKSLTPEELKDFCARSPLLASYKWPREYQIVPDLPHTPTGKLIHYKLRQ